MKVLLLNPPGTALYLRDYFCSKTSQADYLNHPIDLLYLSGQLAPLGEISLVDAIADNLDPLECLHHIRAIDPDIVIGLTGSVSWSEDVPFYRKLSACLNTRIILIGDVLLENRRDRLQGLPFVEAFLHDFSTPDLVRYLKGSSDVSNMTVRVNSEATACPLQRQGGSFRIPVPRHELFVTKNYRYPFVKSRRFATVLTEFGCPFRCNFCVMSTLGWKQRPVEDVLAELDFVRALGVRELFFLDQTFGIRQERMVRLLEAMIRRRYGFGWVAFARPDLLKEDSLALMKSAGCHSLILGLESGSPQVLDAARKDVDLQALEHGFRLARKAGLRRIATVILGLPEETPETFASTMHLLEKLDPEYVSLNTAVPRMGTPLRRKAVDLALVSEDLEVMDQSGHPVAMPTLALSRAEVAALRSRALRNFYLRPGYLGRRVSELARSGSAGEAWVQLKQATMLLRSWLSNRTGP